MHCWLLLQIYPCYLTGFGVQGHICDANMLELCNIELGTFHRKLNLNERTEKTFKQTFYLKIKWFYEFLWISVDFI